MAVHLSTTFIAVNDPDEAIAFYCDGLGLEVRKDISQGPHRWVTVGAPDDDIDVVLFHPHSGRSEQEGDVMQGLLAQGSLHAALFRADDLEATFDRLVALGAEVMEEPTDQFWGVRDCAFRDPSGNMIRISQA